MRPAYGGGRIYGETGRSRQGEETVVEQKDEKKTKKTKKKLEDPDELNLSPSECRTSIFLRPKGNL
jgi:hypothetical protein